MKFKERLQRALLSILVVFAVACDSDGGSSTTPDVSDDAVDVELDADESDLPDADLDAADTTVEYPEMTYARIRDAVIYEIFVRQFSAEGTISAIIPRLPELQELGVTMIWLMPIYPIGEVNRKGTVGSPYSVANYTAIDPAQGTDEDLHALVNAVHDAGMTIIFDWVANHSAFDNPWATENPEWYTQDEDGNIVHPPGTDWTDVADLNYDEPGLRAAMTDALLYWVEEFDIDGYRCDVAEMVPGDFWQEAIAALREVKPVMMLAEGQSRSVHDNGFDLSYQWSDYHAMEAAFDGGPAELLIATFRTNLRELPRRALRIRYSTNHDETAWVGTPLELFGGIEGAEAAFVLMVSVPGVPLVYAGQEVASDVNTPLFEREPIVWDQHPEVREFYREFLSLYRQSDALMQGDVDFLVPDADDIVLLERSTNRETLVVAVNIRHETATLELPAELVGSSFVGAINGESVTFGETLTLDAYEYLLLTPVSE